MFHISRDFNKARSPKGFHMTFENGYTLSVQFGMGNYCSNRHVRTDESVLETIEKYVGPEECKDAETAIIDVDGNHLEYKGEDVQWHQTPDDVAETIAYILTLPKIDKEVSE